MNFAVDDRPTDFSQFVGNESVVNAIKQGLENKTLPNAILFTGSSGTGKSSVTNLIINALNVNKDINLHFIDCGITKDMESFRAIVNSISAPSFGGTRENVVYILEECHKLSASKNAQESMLYILEHLPSNKYVIATTTDPEKLITTFRSRFVEYHLKPLTADEMFNGLLLPIIKKHGIKIKKSTVNLIIEASSGNNRKALSILSSVASLSPEEQERVIVSEAQKDGGNLKDALNNILSLKPTSEFPFIEYIQALKNTDAEPEQVRQFILSYTANLLPMCQTKDLVDRLCFLYDFLRDKPCYDSHSWGVIYCCIREYIRNFIELF